MKTHTIRIRSNSARLIHSLWSILLGTATMQAAEQLQNGSFDSTANWTVVPAQTDTWTCISGGEANLHPPSSYMGPVLTQSLSLANAGGRRIRLSAVLSKVSAPTGSTIAFMVDYLDAANTTKQLTILQPANDTIAFQTALTADAVLPIGAKSVTSFGVHKMDFGMFTLQSVSLDLVAPPLTITSPTAGTVFDWDDTVTVTVSLDTSITGPRNVRIHDNGTQIGAASPTSFIDNWKLADGSIINFQSATLFNYTHEDEYFFFDGAFTNNRFSGNFSAHSIGGMATGTGTLDFAFDANGLLTVNTSGDTPLGVRNLTGGKSTTCATYRFAWKNPSAGQHSLTAVVKHTDTTTSKTYTLASLPVTISVSNPPASPEIVIEQPLGTNLSDGVGTRTFGNANIGQNGIVKTFTIKNTGTATLHGLAITKNGAHAPDFTVGALAKTSLAAGSSINFTVTFNPMAAGPRTTALHIASNDANENPFDITLTGTGVALPEITVEQPAGKGLADGANQIAFGIVPVGSTGKTKTFIIRNKGKARLTGLTITKNGTHSRDFIALPPEKSNLPAGDFTTFRVTCKPRSAGTRNAAIHIQSNDADENPFDIKVTGIGANP